MNIPFEGFIDPTSLEKRYPEKDTGQYSGVYFLFYKEKILYIGSTRNVRMRIPAFSSWVTRQYKKLVFDHWVFVPSKASEMRALERKYISLYRPANNTYFNPDRKVTREWYSSHAKKRAGKRNQPKSASRG